LKIAVYGSLKREGKLHFYMQDAQYLGATTFPGDLYSLGSFPAAVPGQGQVHCEVFECTDALIERLDSLEGHPWIYRRSPVETAKFGSVQAYIYQRRLHSWDKKIESGLYNTKDWK
jgi:gamma-glutamylcyclotransferase (GGCT)/AIG2-like uncharacterized protein YtfP